ncbi:MAG: M48 family metallopeptidase [Planctomycetaceae bacterium]
MVFLAALAGMLLGECFLIARQAARVRRNRGAVPELFRDAVSLPEHQKAADYTLARLAFRRVALLVEAALLAAWTLGGGLDALDRAWRAAGLGPILTGTGFLVSAALLADLLALPFVAYRTFVLEKRFGFNRTAPRLFVADTVRRALLSLLFLAPLAWGAVLLMEQGGPLWWISAWAGWMAALSFLLWLLPTVIAPLFNRFTPLPEGPLRERLQGLVDRCGFSTRGIFVMDGSRRSAHSNAYFTGLGRAKRVVLFDTLLKQLEPDEMEAVLAHELGHAHHRHLPRRLAANALLSLAGFGLLAWFRDAPWLFHGLGLTHPSSHAALLLFLWVGPVLTWAFRPLPARLSRRQEFQADDFAAENAGPDPMARTLVKIYRHNASTLTPDPLYSAFHDSHPPPPIRVARLHRAAAGRIPAEVS